MATPGSRLEFTPQATGPVIVRGEGVELITSTSLRIRRATGRNEGTAADDLPVVTDASTPTLSLWWMYVPTTPAGFSR